jgi:hypothetical protein
MKVLHKSKKHLQLKEEMFNSFCLRNESYNEIFLIIILISKVLLQKCPTVLSSILCSI